MASTDISRQLHRLVVPAGIFNPARTYSLVCDDDGLYVLFTGRAMGNRPMGITPAHAIAGAILDKIADKREKEIAGVEEHIRSAPAKAVVSESKHSRYLARASIKSIEIKTGAWVRVVVEAEKKMSFHCWQDEQAVRAFFAPLA
jgi:hypothetical protein